MLPEGATTEATFRFDVETDWTIREPSGERDEFTLLSVMRDTVRYRIVDVNQGRLYTLTETHLAGEVWERRAVDGRVVQDDTEPVLGANQTVLIEKTDQGWRHTPQGETVSDEFLDLISDLQGSPPDAVVNYELDHSFAVGETWEVPVEIQRLVFTNLLPDSPHTMWIRLDSLGTEGTAPMAYLSGEYEHVTTFGDGGYQRVRGTRRYSRRTDVNVTVRLDIESTVTAEAPGHYADGSPFKARLESRRRFQSVQTVSLPDE